MAAKKKIDLSTLDTVAACNKPYKLELVHPITKEPLGQYIMLLGKDSDICKQYQDDQANENIRRQAMANRTGKDMPIRTVEDIRREGTELLVMLTVGFESIDYHGSYEFTPANAFKLYTEQNWIRKQVDDATFDIENFMKN